jgi:hypothetical protein
MGCVMPKILIIAACASGLVHPAFAQSFVAQPSPADPKYNSPECRAARAQTYDGLSPGQTRALSLVSGFAGTLAERRREMFERQIELACMSNPPQRPELEPGFTITKD